MSGILVKKDTAMNMKMVGYWTATVAVAFELLLGGVMSLVRGRTMLIGKPLVESQAIPF